MKMFKDELDFLSNMYEVPVVWKGCKAMSSEHHYQAEKFLDKKMRQRVVSASSGKAAKNLARKYKKFIRPDWELISLEVMNKVVQAKFFQNVELLIKLCDIDGEIVENNFWHDNFWGNCICGRPECAGDGKNHLGKILMDIREEMM